MKTLASFVIFFLVLSIIYNNCLAQRTWTGAVNQNWSTPGNWSGNALPLAGESVTFNGGGNGNCLVDIVPPALDGITISGYTGTIDLQGNTITSSGVASSSFTTGTIINSGALASISITTTGTTTFQGTTQFGTAASTGVQVTITSRNIYLNRATFRGQVSLTKTAGGVDNGGTGGNTFHGPVSITNNSNNYFASATTVGGADIFNSTLTLTNTGTNLIRMSESANGTQFNGNIIVNNTNAAAASGIYFGQVSGGSTLADGVTITIGGSGFAAGRLRLQRMQFGTTGAAVAQNLTFAGGNTVVLKIGPSTTFNSNVTFSASGIELSGAVYNGNASITKTGASNDSGAGGNVFNQNATQNTTITNNGSGSLTTGTTSADVFNAPVTFTSSPGLISVANDQSATFNDNVIVNSISGNGLRFGDNGPGTVTLTAGHTITTGSSGFNSGMLRLRRFTQVGGTPQTLTLTGTALLTLGSAGPTTTFNGDVSFIAPQVLLDGTTFNGTAIIEKNGALDNLSAGDNVFNGTTTLTNSNNVNVSWVLAFVLGDKFNGNVTFSRTGNGAFRIAHSGVNLFTNSITINSTGVLTFGEGTGTVELTGTNVQTINKTGGSASPVFQRFTLNKGGGSATLNTDLTVGVAATFTSGVLNTTSTNFLNFANDATTSGASNTSHVDGPVRKTGDDAFTFPVGDNGYYRLASISTPTNVNDYFTAQYFNAAQSFGFNKDAAILTMSDCEYWTIDRSPGGTNVYVTLSWYSPMCPTYGITDVNHMKVLHWNSGTNNWENLGNGATTGNTTAGTVRTTAQVTAFSPFTLGSSSVLSPLPIELIEFTATAYNNAVSLTWSTSSEIHNDHFIIEHSSDGKEFLPIGRVEGNGTTNEIHNYSFTDTKSFTGKNYYRLAQYDLDGKKQYSPIRYINIESQDGPLSIAVYPNPAKDEIRIRSTRFLSKASIVFYDLLSGVIAWEKQFDLFAWEQVVNINSIKPGLYRVFVSSENAKANERVVVVR